MAKMFTEKQKHLPIQRKIHMEVIMAAEAHLLQQPKEQKLMLTVQNTIIRQKRQ
jgi:hypothetical protein